MIIFSIKSGATDLRRIELSDGSFFSFKTCYLPPVFIDESLYTPGTAEGREVNAAEEAAFRFASACMRAEKAALQLIARAEQNIFGLSRKLDKRGHDSACVRAAVSRLAELGLLNDRRYAQLWLESRIRQRPSSPRRLLAALCARGIDRDDAEPVLKAVLDEEAELALLLRYAKKLRLAKKKPRTAKQRASWQQETGQRDAEYAGSADAALRSLKYMLKGEGFSTAAIQQYFDMQDGAEQ